MKWSEARGDLLKDPAVYREFVKETKLEGALEFIEEQLEHYEGMNEFDGSARYDQAIGHIIQRLRSYKKDYQKELES